MILDEGKSFFPDEIIRIRSRRFLYSMYSATIQWWKSFRAIELHSGAHAKRARTDKSNRLRTW